MQADKGSPVKSGERKGEKVWCVTLQHAGTRKTKDVTMPGGLHEADARRAAVSKAGAYWQPVAAALIFD
jgi:hypothetical protein